MRKPIGYVTRKPQYSYMNFRVFCETGDSLLFTMPYNKNVYQFFEKGKSLGEVRKFNKWRRNDVLSRNIEKKIPYELNKLRKEGIFIDSR